MAKSPGGLEALAVQLKALSDSIAGEESSQIPSQQAKKIHRTIGEAYDKLSKVLADLDPIKHPGFVFDPSNPNVVGRVIGITMVAQARKPLASVERFYGSGVSPSTTTATFLHTRRYRRKSTRSMLARLIRQTRLAKPLRSREIDSRGVSTSIARMSPKQELR